MTQQGYGQAYQKGFGRTVRFLCSRGVLPDHAEDVAQEAWLRGWQKLDQLRDESMVLSWVNTIAINYHRYRGRVESRYQALTDLRGDIGIDMAPLDAAKILNLCTPRERILFERQMGGSTTEEMAKEQGVTETTIRIRFMRARRAVRACVEARSFSSAVSNRPS